MVTTTRTRRAFVCACCGRVRLAPQGTGGTGYGWRDDALLCYLCCSAHERADMVRTGTTCLYLVRDASGAWSVTDWPGTLRFPCPAPRRSDVGGCVSAERRDTWFRGPDGFRWHFVSRGDMDVGRARRTKVRA